MCVAAYGTVIEIEDNKALVDFNGNRVSARFGPLFIKPGDKVLVHAGLVIQVIKEDMETELKELKKLMEE